jgi:hypothetical protein
MRVSRVLAGVALMALILAITAGCSGLTVRSNPDGADIYLNGADKGAQTPHRFGGLPSGTYEITVAKDGYESETKSVAYAKGDKLKIDFVLHEKPVDKRKDVAIDHIKRTPDNGVPPEFDFNGFAVIKNGDVDRARTDAINSAIMAEMEQRFGPLAAQNERINNFDLYRGRLLESSKIYRVDVVQEEAKGDKYYVKVNVVFSSDKVKESDLPKLTVIFDVTPDAFGRELERLLIGANLGLNIVNNGPREDEADLVIRGRADAAESARQGNEFTYRCDAVVSVKRRISKEPVTLPEAHILGKPRFTKEDAERAAMNAAAEQVFKELRDSLIARSEDLVERVLIIRDVKDLKAAEGIIKKIQQIEGVTDVNTLSYREDAKVLTVLLKMKVMGGKNFDYYLSHLKGIELKDLSSNGGVIRGRVD